MNATTLTTIDPAKLTVFRTLEGLVVAGKWRSASSRAAFLTLSRTLNMGCEHESRLYWSARLMRHFGPLGRKAAMRLRWI